MTECPFISIIVAVYNVELYIRKCLESIRAQTFYNFEVILVDDGSTDRSRAICDEFVIKDSRFKVFYKENGGVSSARNFGLDHSQGDYITHLDPDDYVSKDFLKDVFDVINEKKPEILILDFFKKNLHDIKYVSALSSIYTDVKANALESIFCAGCLNLWNSIILKDYYIRHNMRFPLALFRSEDTFLLSIAISKAERISYLPKAYYTYVIREGSLSHLNDKARYVSALTLANEFLSINDLSSYIHPYLSKITFGCFFGLYMVERDEKFIIHDLLINNEINKYFDFKKKCFIFFVKFLPRRAVRVLYYMLNKIYKYKK